MQDDTEGAAPFYDGGTVTLYNADCRDILAQLPEHSIDAVVTDPPYEYNFKAHAWDASGIAYSVDLWRQVYRVLKPGGHLLSFGGSRTYHRMAVAVEDAGFEIRDSIHWVYSSGFPKSHAIGKAIDKLFGAEREVVGSKRLTGNALTPTKEKGGTYGIGVPNVPSGDIPITAPATDEARQWEGWGTCLKPSHEIVVLARKPISEPTVARNVLRWGTGAINIDGTRITAENEELGRNNHKPPYSGGRCMNVASTPPQDSRGQVPGRWMPNMMISHHPDCEVAGEVEEPGYTINRWTDGAKPFGNGAGHDFASSQTQTAKRKVYRCVAGCAVADLNEHTGIDAARFFPESGFTVDDYRPYYYVSKANRKDRNAGLDRPNANTHSTVKPVALMRWLVRLITPPDGIVLDPFLGSGTTGVAAVQEGVRFLGVEKDTKEGYCEIAEARIQFAQRNVRAEQITLFSKGDAP